MDQKKSKRFSAVIGVDAAPESAPGVNVPIVTEVWTAGGPVWINFANTVALADKGMTDVVSSPDALRWWFGVVALVAPSRLESKDLAFAAGLRESLSRVIDRIERGASIEALDLELFNSVLGKQHEWHQLVQIGEGVIVRKRHRSVETIEQALGPVVESLSETLVHGDLRRLRSCAHQGCTLSFYDDSKNGARRWCTMSGCGNRAKATAYLQRKKLRA